MRAGLRSRSTGQLGAGSKGPHVKCVQRAGRNGTGQRPALLLSLTVNLAHAQLCPHYLSFLCPALKDLNQ